MNSRQRRPGAGRLGRFWRGVRPDRNPLRRVSDRVETAVLAVLAVALLAGAPFAAMAAGSWARTAAEHLQAQQRSTRQVVPAVVLKAPPATAIEGRSAQARWTAPDGSTVTSDIPAPYNTRAGATVPVWVTRDGTPAQPPLLDSQVSSLAQLAEAGAVVMLTVTLTVTGVLARRSLDKRRIAAWDAEWRSGPRWTTRA